MRIGFDAKRAFHNFRGLGNYSRDLLAGLNQYYSRNDYLLFSPPLKDQRAFKWRDEYSSFEVITPTSFLGKKFSTAWRSLFLTDELKNHELDIFHGLSHELPPGIEKSGIKSIVTIHDLIFMRYPEFFPWVDRKVYLKKVRYACEAAALIICICNQTKEDVVNFLGVNPDKIRVVYQTCNPRFYTPMEEDKMKSILSKYGVDGKYILNVGAIEPRKNALNLVKAFANLKKESNRNLILVGNGGEYKKEIETYIESKDLGDRIKIISNVTHTDLPAFYQGADLFCYPSHFEGFGIPIIEALFSKTPVITSKGSCFPEAGGPDSVYIDSESIPELTEAIERVLTDDKLRYKMIENGRNFVEKFHRSKTSERLIEVYEEVKRL
jgi:glycosyltransferase involved in cell wall biosynthesis